MSNSEYSIVTENLCKNFGRLEAVKKINLSIRNGELFALLGPNGAGKTTTIKMLSCLTMPSSGTAKILGNDIINRSKEVKKILDISPQETAIAVHLNAMENLMLMGGIYGLSRKQSRERALELIEMTGLQGRLKDQVRKFSGGMQRRLSIAMALMSRPKVLFMDEPTLGLDPQARRSLWNEIEKLKGNTTILLTTHYLEEADALADRIAFIDKGKIVAQGTSEELKENLFDTMTVSIKTDNMNDSLIRELKGKYQSVAYEKQELIIKDKQSNIDFHEIMNFLKLKNINILSINTKEPTLDDVYLKHTGQ